MKQIVLKQIARFFGEKSDINHISDYENIFSVLLGIIIFHSCSKNRKKLFWKEKKCKDNKIVF